MAQTRSIWEFLLGIEQNVKYIRIFIRFSINEWEKGVYRLVRSRELRTTDLGNKPVKKAS